ncbi:MAG TPA: cobalamin-binding protein [Phototrophicaceae bacterium]|nr:cobalamin-binding protein [Phototrophicaceae bacterium]
MGYDKIISFLPSATEILFEIGLGDALKGVTHECTYPIKASEKPNIISPSFDANGLSSVEIDKKIRDLSISKKPIFNIDSKKVKEIKPDLIISQNLCEVCAPFSREIQQVYSILGYKPRNLELNPKNVYDIFDSIIIIGQETGHIEKAQQIVNKLAKRIDQVKQKIESSDTENKSKKQKIICLEWVSPFYIAGHWVPQMVELVDGINGIGKIGEMSKIISVDDIAKFDPDKIIMMPCGFDIERTCKEVMDLNKNKMWNSLKAVKTQKTYVVDANSYFSKPSPRIVTGIEILAKILHPDLFEGLQVPGDGYRNMEICQSGNVASSPFTQVPDTAL